MPKITDGKLDGEGFMLPGLLDQKLSRRGAKKHRKANLQYGEGKGSYIKEGRLSSLNKISRSNHNNGSSERRSNKRSRTSNVNPNRKSRGRKSR